MQWWTGGRDAVVTSGRDVVVTGGSPNPNPNPNPNPLVGQHELHVSWASSW